MASSKKPKKGAKLKRKPKRPPPKDKDPYGLNSYGVEPRTQVASIEPAEEGEAVGNTSWLRESAAIQYITSMDGISIRELHQIPPFNTVAQSTLERWSAEDEWLNRRQDYFRAIRAKIETRLTEKLVETRVKQLEQMDDLVQTLMTSIPTAEVNSKEGLVNAIVRLVESNDRIREKITKDVVPEHLGGVSSDSGVKIAPDLDEDDVRSMVKAVLKKRRDKIRAKQRAEQEAKEDAPKRTPKLKVLKGSNDG